MSSSGIVILDYDLGNVRSIGNALAKLDCPHVLTRATRDIDRATALILPGVGAYAYGMESLRRYGLIEPVMEFARSGRPLLGICLGMQLLFDTGEEFGLTPGLGLIKGAVRKLPLVATDEVRLPHIAWTGVNPPIGRDWKDTVMEQAEPGTFFYFVHSFAGQPENPEDILGISRYGGHEFVSMVKHGMIHGCQFHPERSADGGLALLGAFANLAASGKENVS